MSKDYVPECECHGVAYSLCPNFRTNKFNRAIHEGKDCPECGGIHYGSRYCPSSAEGIADSDAALKARQELDASKPKPERTYTESEKQASVAAALREIANHVPTTVSGEKDSFVISYGACSCGNLKADGVTRWEILWRQHIESLIDQPSSAALDEYVAEKVAEVHQFYQTGRVYTEWREIIDKLWEEQVNAAVLAESEWWAKAHGKCDEPTNECRWIHERLAANRAASVAKDQNR